MTKTTSSTTSSTTLPTNTTSSSMTKRGAFQLPTTTTTTTTTPMIYFGTLNEEIITTMLQSMQTQLNKGLLTLPTFIQQADQNRLLVYNTIMKQYMIAIDFIELYNLRNLFTIRPLPSTKHSKTRTMMIEQYYRQYLEEEQPDEGEGGCGSSDRSTGGTNSTTGTCTTWNEDDWICTTGTGTTERDDDMDHKDTIDGNNRNDTDSYPMASSSSSSSSQIITTKDMEETSEEIRTLHFKLQQLHDQEKALQNELRALRKMETNHRNHNQIMNDETNLANVVETITNSNKNGGITSIVQTMHQCQTVSDQLQQCMDTIEQDRYQQKKQMMSTNRHDSNTSSASKENDGNRINNGIVDPSIIFDAAAISITKSKSIPPSTTTNPSTSTTTTIQQRYENDSLVVARFNNNTNNNTNNKKNDDTNHGNGGQILASIRSNLLV